MTTVDAPPVRAASLADPRDRRDVVLLVLAALVLRLPALVSSTVLVYDDGSFGASALALRRGNVPFREVFSSQGPLFLPLVWVADAVGLRTLNAPRLLDVAAGVLVTVAVYAAARRMTSRGAAILAAALVTSSGSVLWVTTAVNADGPSMALAALAFALALRYRDAPSTGLAVAIGLTLGAVVSIKLLAAPVMVPIGLLLGARRRPRDLILVAAVPVAVYLVAAAPWGLDDVIEQSFRYHRDSAREQSVAGAAAKLVSTLTDRDLPVVIVAVLSGVTALARRGSARPRRTGRGGSGARALPWIVAAWLGALVVVLVAEPALFRSHVAQVIPPLALLAAYRPPPWRVLVITAIVLTPYWLVRNRQVLWPEPLSGWQAELVAELSRVPEDALVLGDDPGLAWRADRAIPGFYVDPSFKRIEQGQITEDSLVAEASEPDVCAVYATSPRHFLRFVGLGERLTFEGYEVAATFGEGRTLWVRPDCPR